MGDITSALGEEGGGGGEGCSVHWRDIRSTFGVFSALEDMISELGEYHYCCGTPAMH